MQTGKFSQAVSNSLHLIGMGVVVGVAACGIAAFRFPNASNRIGQLCKSAFGDLGTRRFYSGGFKVNREFFSI